MHANGMAPGTRSRFARALALLAAGVLVLSIGTASVSAGSGRAATFTKWITAWPEMGGVVGGSVGDGTFSGTVVDYAPGPTTLITAIYRFGGSHHAFTARMHVEQTGLDAVLVGVVTDGWHQGKVVTGAYTQITCEHGGVSSDCFRGYLVFGTGD